MRRRDPHWVDEHYDGVVSAMSLSGGVAAIDQLATWLGGRAGAEAFANEVLDRRMGTRLTLPGDHAEAIGLRRTAMRILIGRSTPSSLLEWAQYSAIHRFEFYLREGRPLHPMAWVWPSLFIDGEPLDPAAATTLWRSLARIDSLFVDLHPDGARVVVIDRFFTVRHFQHLLARLTRYGQHLGQIVDLRVLCGSPLHRQRARRRLTEAEETLPAAGVTWGVMQLDTVRYFAAEALTPLPEVTRAPPSSEPSPPAREPSPAETLSG